MDSKRKIKSIGQISLPDTWISLQNEEAVEVPLNKDSPEYSFVSKLLSGPSLCHLTKIVQVQNPHLYGRYLLRNAEYETRGQLFQEMTLLHATDAFYVQSIIKNNLDWRLVKRSKYGRGVSFSPDANYANKYCSQKCGTLRAMIVCKVLVGRKCAGNYKIKIPEQGIDTTTGSKKKVYVKYYDDEFYPEYVAYYNNYNLEKPLGDVNIHFDRNENYNTLDDKEYNEILEKYSKIIQASENFINNKRNIIQDEYIEHANISSYDDAWDDYGYYIHDDYEIDKYFGNEELYDDEEGYNQDDKEDCYFDSEEIEYDQDSYEADEYSENEVSYDEDIDNEMYYLNNYDDIYDIEKDYDDERYLQDDYEINAYLDGELLYDEEIYIQDDYEEDVYFDNEVLYDEYSDGKREYDQDSYEADEYSENEVSYDEDIDNEIYYLQEDCDEVDSSNDNDDEIYDLENDYEADEYYDIEDLFDDAIVLREHYVIDMVTKHKDMLTYLLNNYIMTRQKIIFKFSYGGEKYDKVFTVGLFDKVYADIEEYIPQESKDNSKV